MKKTNGINFEAPKIVGLMTKLVGAASSYRIKEPRIVLRYNATVITALAGGEGHKVLKTEDLLPYLTEMKPDFLKRVLDCIKDDRRGRTDDDDSDEDQEIPLRRPYRLYFRSRFAKEGLRIKGFVRLDTLDVIATSKGKAKKEIGRYKLAHDGVVKVVEIPLDI